MEVTGNNVITRCNELKTYWEPRNRAMKRWYRLIEMVDELKTDKMESFVGNDPRALYNLVLHLLDAEIPHRIKEYDMNNLEVAAAVASVSTYFRLHWKDAKKAFRRTKPNGSLTRTFMGYMLSTGWYAMFSIMSDDGKRTYKEPWNPAEVYPMWDEMSGINEVAHITTMSSMSALRMAQRNDWTFDIPYRQWLATVKPTITVYDYWWTETMDTFPYITSVWNAVVLDNQLVKAEPTRFRRIPIYVSPVGGLPDMGTLTDTYQANVYSSTFKVQTQDVPGDRWKAEIGQAIVATNENVYKTWNKWWTFSLQLLRDTAQPRIFERSRSGKAIVKPEDVFRRGAIFRGGPDDTVEFIGAPPIPLEIRSTQLDLEAMMQRGGVSWAMHGSVAGQISAYVMSQIAASANQVMKPFHQAIVDAFSDMDNDDLEDIRTRSIQPYGWKYPKDLPVDVEVSADYDVEIPGDLIQRATTARMLYPDFTLSYSYVMGKLFPDVEDPMRERARVRADQASMHPSNSMIALVTYYRQQAAYLSKIGDAKTAKLYEMMADVVTAQLMPQSGGQAMPTGETIPASRQIAGLGRPEAMPEMPTGERMTGAEIGGQRG